MLPTLGASIWIARGDVASKEMTALRRVEGRIFQQLISFNPLDEVLAEHFCSVNFALPGEVKLMVRSMKF